MSAEPLTQLVTTFVLVFFRLAGMALMAPLFGSNRIPVRVRVLLVLVLTVGMMPGLAVKVMLPASTWHLAAAIGGEMAFGLAMGMILSFVFVAVQWAGELIGQQMGLTLSETIDPQFGGQSSVVGDLYFMLTLIIFLAVRGHHALLRGVRASFESLPLLSTGIDGNALDILVGLFHGATALAIQLAAPMLVTMLLVDLALGFISKTVPQLNVLSAGLTLRAMIGMVILVVGIAMTSEVIRGAVLDGMDLAWEQWSGSAVIPNG